MKYKTVFIFICLTVCLLAVAGVSAADDAVQAGNETADEIIASDDAVGQEDIGFDGPIGQEDIESGDAVGLDDGEENIGANEWDELQDLIDNANGELNLTKNYIHQSLNKNDIKIKKSITINGNGKTLDGYGGPIFSLESDKISVTLKNIKFTGALGSDGAAINLDYHKSVSLTIIGCTFNSNKAGTSGLGGAIFFNSRDGKLTVINSTFSHNDARKIGGAIYCQDCNVHVENSSFRGNIAGHSKTEGGGSGEGGAAIYCEGCGDSTIINSIFKDNENSGDGGMVRGGAVCFTNKQNMNLIVKNTDFINHHATENGGALYCDGNMQVYSSNFEKNSAEKGGAIYCHGECSVYDSTFRSNTGLGFLLASGYGGAIYAGKIKTVENCIFDNNSIDVKAGFYSDGGAIYIDKECKPEFISCSFESNDATSNGGAIYLNSAKSYLKLSGCNFTANTAYIDGGAVYTSGEIAVTDCVFRDNKALGKSTLYRSFGGAFRSKSATITNCYFTGNHAHDWGGAAYIDSWAKITGTTFNENDAHEAGAVYAGGLTASNSKFTGNHANSGSGGAVYVNGKDNPKFTSCTFEQNTCTGDGGAIHLNSAYSYMTLSQCTFTDNKAGRGGAVYAPSGIASNSLVDLDNCRFTGNSAKQGGAVYASTISKISHTEFIKNRATSGSGGAVYVNNQDVTSIESCRFQENTCTENGGAIYFDSANAQVKLFDSIFTSNHADNHGGAVYAGKWANYLVAQTFSRITQLENCRFEDNSAIKGGAIYVSKIENKVSKSVFIKNRATYGKGKNDGDGGAIYVFNDCAYSITSCRFEQNSAYNRGGAVYMDSMTSTLSVYACTFVANNAEKKKYSGSLYHGPGHSIFNSGYYDVFDMCWLGKNDPGKNDLAGQFVEWRSGRSDLDHTPKHILKISMYLDENMDNIHKNSTYKVTVHLYADGKNLDSDLLHSTGSFYGDGEFSNVKTEDRNDMTGDVVFIKDNPTIYGKLDNQVLQLSLNAKDKQPSEVRIISCEDVKYPNAVNVTYEISHMMDGASYVIRNPQGTIVREGNLTSSNNLIVEKLLPGEYSITITNPESRTSLAGSNTTNFTVNKGDIDLMLVVVDETYPEVVECVIHASVDGKYQLDVGGCSTVVKVKNHVAHFNRGTLDAGTYEAIVSFEGNDLYNPVSNRTMFRVSPQGTLFEIQMWPDEISYGETATVLHMITPGATGKIRYYLHNGTLLGESSPGENFTLPTLNAASYVIIANYTGDLDHLSASDVAYLTVNRANPAFSIEALPVAYGSNATVAHSLPDGATGKIRYWVNGTLIAELPLNANLSLPVWDAGTYAITASYSGDANFINATAETTLTVTKLKTVIIADELITEYKSDDYLVIVLKDGNGKQMVGFNVTVDFNGVFNFTTDENGQIRISTSGLASDTYNVTFTFNGTQNHLNCSNATQAFISTRQSKMTTNPVITTYQVHKYLVVNLKDESGNPISNMDTFITINGVTYNCITDDKGDARLIIRLNPKVYVATATFDNANYTMSLEFVKVTVYKATPKLTAKNKKFKASKKVKKYVVILKDNVGKAIGKAKLTLKIKGKTYRAKTNSNGKAVFKIKNLNKKGKYKATVTFSGNSHFNMVSKKVKINSK